MPSQCIACTDVTVAAMLVHCMLGARLRMCLLPLSRGALGKLRAEHHKRAVGGGVMCKPRTGSVVFEMSSRYFAMHWLLYCATFTGQGLRTKMVRESLEKSANSKRATICSVRRCLGESVAAIAFEHASREAHDHATTPRAQWQGLCAVPYKRQCGKIKGGSLGCNLHVHF